MRVSDEALQQLETEGYVIVPGFLNADELAAARAGLWRVFPHPDDYHAEPSKHVSFSSSQFAGLRNFPFASYDINRLAHHPDLVDAAERYLGSTDLALYKIELWAKYSGAIDYDQKHHRDFGNHSIVVPKTDASDRQVTTFMLLSDVDIDDGPTAVVPLRYSRDLSLIPEDRDSKFGMAASNDAPLRDVEVPVVGPAGTLFMYRTDIYHRATAMRGEKRSRFVLLADYMVRGPSWAGRIHWADRALSPQWNEVMERATVRERDLFGFPKPADPYWDAQTLRDVGLRYPNMDMTPYAAAVPPGATPIA
jgi:hypothetical protein